MKFKENYIKILVANVAERMRFHLMKTLHADIQYGM
jgi:hypothetical protein